MPFFSPPRILTFLCPLRQTDSRMTQDTRLVQLTAASKQLPARADTLTRVSHGAIRNSSVASIVGQTTTGSGCLRAATEMLLLRALSNEAVLCIRATEQLSK
jgi:hypothetical protein